MADVGGKRAPSPGQGSGDEEVKRDTGSGEQGGDRSGNQDRGERGGDVGGGPGAPGGGESRPW